MRSLNPLLPATRGAVCRPFSTPTSPHSSLVCTGVSIWRYGAKNNAAEKSPASSHSNPAPNIFVLPRVYAHAILLTTPSARPGDQRAQKHSISGALVAPKDHLALNFKRNSIIVLTPLYCTTGVGSGGAAGAEAPLKLEEPLN